MSRLDWVVLFTTRALRMMSYGGVTLIFMIAMTTMLDAARVSIILTGILLGDLLITLFLTTHADRYGRRMTLLVGAVLKIFAGLVFANSNNFFVLLLTGIVGVISPVGGDMGPFMAIEQSSLTQLCAVDGDAAKSTAHITTIFSWYQLVGSISLALGALGAGYMVSIMQSMGHSAEEAYSAVFMAYAAFGGMKAILYALLSPEIEVPTTTENVSLVIDSAAIPTAKPVFGGMLVGLECNETRITVAKLAAMFSLDAFAGGLVLQSFISWWFSVRWGLDPKDLGNMLLWVNVISGASGLVSGYLVKMFGAINTMVFTHLPSNILLGSIPLMGSGSSAVGMLLARYSISQMDVPARQAYVAIVVKATERSAASGWTNCARSIGVSLAPLLLWGLSFEEGGGLNAHARRKGHPKSSFDFAMPFYIAGALKCLYDIMLYGLFWHSRSVGSNAHSSANGECRGLIRGRTPTSGHAMRTTPTSMKNYATFPGPHRRPRSASPQLHKMPW